MSIENDQSEKDVDLIELTRNFTIEDNLDRAAFKNIFALKDVLEKSGKGLDTSTVEDIDLRPTIKNWSVIQDE